MDIAADDRGRTAIGATIINGLVQTIESHGFRVDFRDLVGHTFTRYPDVPLWLYSEIVTLGLTNRSEKLVVVTTHDRTEHEIIQTLLHELHHVQDDRWNCGSISLPPPPL